MTSPYFKNFVTFFKKNAILLFGQQLQISYDFKYGNIYRDVIHTPTFDFCEVTKAGSTNPLISQLIPNPVHRKNIDALIHECPYQVPTNCSSYLQSKLLFPRLSNSEILHPNLDSWKLFGRLVTIGYATGSPQRASSLLFAEFSWPWHHLIKIILDESLEHRKYSFDKKLI